MRVYGRLRTILLALVVLATAAPTASALVVHNRNGHFYGITVHRGISAGAVRNSLAGTRTSSPSGGASPSQSVQWQGGPVMHSSAPYLVFWTPSGESVPGEWQSWIDRYFGDVAADSGKASNVYSALRQYTDGSGFADYQQTFGGAQVVTDTDTYPGVDHTYCPKGTSPCLTDAQLQSELSKLILAKKLPTDGSAKADALPASAPIYLVVLPTDVNLCFSGGSSAGTCASNDFCSYHSFYADGTNNVVYAAIPTLPLVGSASEKTCQPDGNKYIQEPNGSDVDVALKYIGHENSEAITDPLLTGWWDNAGSQNTNPDWGNEVGDICNGTASNANAFGTPLGGEATPSGTNTYGTLYNQVIDGDHYYLQGEWSNGDANCVMHASSGTVTAALQLPASPRNPGTQLSFDPTLSKGTNPYSSETLDWGDKTAPAFSANPTLAPLTHTYAKAGYYPVTLTLVDNRGNLRTTTDRVAVGEPTAAAFTSSPSQPHDRDTVNFDAGASTGSGLSYAWDFGDGTTATGAAPTHSYAASGIYLVRLTVTDGSGNVDTATDTVRVSPTAAFTIGNVTPEAGQSVAFDGSASDDGSIASYAWDFGDGTTGTGATPSHSYTSSGTHTVSLTVTDAAGLTDTITHDVTVAPGPVASLTSSPGSPLVGTTVGFDGGQSSDGSAGATITSYAWDFGDESGAAGATVDHVYANAGVYTVTLTVSDSNGATNTATEQITVAGDQPTAAFSAAPATAAPGQPVAFSAAGSTAPDGSIVSYAWEFGDGSGGSGPAPSHAYATAGTYPVALTVTDARGYSDTVSGVVTVVAPAAPAATVAADESPTAAITVTSSSPVAGRAVTFGGAGSSDPDGSIVSYRWSYGDGATATGPASSHTYSRGGTYAVSLTVTDSSGRSATSVRSVAVARGGQITKVAIRPSRGGATVAVSVSSAGTLTVGRRIFHLKRAGTARVLIALTRAQLHAVQVKRQLKVRVPVRFVPVVGPLATTSAVIAFRRA